MHTQLFDNTFINSVFRQSPDDYISREDVLGGEYLKIIKNDIIILEGQAGVGKNTFLQHFAKQFAFTSACIHGYAQKGGWSSEVFFELLLGLCGKKFCAFSN